MIVDYLQLMTSGTSVENRVQEVSQISRALKVLARDLDVPIIALSQLSRAVEQRHDKRPILSDLRESGSIEQDADLVMFVYRDEYYNPEETDSAGIAELILAKHRNGATDGIEARVPEALREVRRPGGRRMTTTVWLSPSATSFSCLCEPCLETARVVGRALRRRALRARASAATVAPRGGGDRRRAARAGHEIVLRRVERPPALAQPRRAAAADRMIERQHVWLGPEATSFDEPCEACLSRPRVARRGRLRRARHAAARRRRRLHDLPARPPHRRAPRRAPARARDLRQTGRMTVVLVALAFAFAWSIGSHYTGACMGMPYALGAISARRALLLMAPLALLGAWLASGKVAATVGRKLIDATPTRLGEVVVVAVAFGVTAIYNRVRIPTSTIQILVGAVVGMAVASSVGVHWRTIGVLARDLGRGAAGRRGDRLPRRQDRSARCARVGAALVLVGCLASFAMGANDVALASGALVGAERAERAQRGAPVRRRDRAAAFW